MKIMIVGLGTIGEPLARLLLNMRYELDIEEVLVHKNTPNIKHRSALERICKDGAKLVVYDEKRDDFIKFMSSCGILPSYTFFEALKIADIIVHCTEAGVANKLKSDYYQNSSSNDKRQLFIAQGSEHGFGAPYAHGINDEILASGNKKFIQVASCNTHQILSVIKTLTLKNNSSILDKARFYIGRRSNDISQVKSIISVEVGVPDDDHYGSHQGADAIKVLDSVGFGDLDVHTIADKLSNPFMHVVDFNITTFQKMTVENVENLFRENPLTAVTYRLSNNEVFNEGRSWGLYGRILNQTVLCLPSLQVISDGYEVIGRCFTPQDGNVILSNLAAILSFNYPQKYPALMKEHFYNRRFLFGEI